jgi:alpha-tubulin suppressor-like RCC1 family protein
MNRSKTNKHASSREALPVEIFPQIPFIPVAWGWNGNYRCGNLTDSSHDQPQQVQRCPPNNFIAGFASKTHSLLINSNGNVFTFGSGQRGQLGYGNAFTDIFLPNKTLQQGVPKQITPTGNIHRNKDLKFQQVTGGSEFSLAREISTEEALDLVNEFTYLESHISTLLQMYGDACSSLLHCKAIIRHERCLHSQSAQGRVVAFGVGVHGELGLGRYTTYCMSPMIIPRLRHVCIVKISSGEKHTLAIDNYGYLYSWVCYHRYI